MFGQAIVQGSFRGFGDTPCDPNDPLVSCAPTAGGSAGAQTGASGSGSASVQTGGTGTGTGAAQANTGNSVSDILSAILHPIDTGEAIGAAGAAAAGAATAQVTTDAITVAKATAKAGGAAGAAAVRFLAANGDLFAKLALALGVSYTVATMVIFGGGAVLAITLLSKK